MEYPSNIRRDAVFFFGDAQDGVVGVPVITEDGHVVEASCFFGSGRPKNIIVISSQVGCPVSCSFCELGGVRRRRDLTAQEMIDQVSIVKHEAGRQGIRFDGRPYKVTVANGGEPLLNPNTVKAVVRLANPYMSVKVSTVLPAGAGAARNLSKLAYFARNHSQPVQLQVSLISTDEATRMSMTDGRVVPFSTIRDIGQNWRRLNPGGRKINLSLIVTDRMPCEAEGMSRFFPPEWFRFRFREYVPTLQGQSFGHKTVSRERLREIKKDFSDHGYEVSDWASPSPVERRFGLASNVIRRMYLDMLSEI